MENCVCHMGDFLNEFMHYVHAAIYTFTYTLPHNFQIYG